jgi:hypothetical protein
MRDALLRWSVAIGASLAWAVFGGRYLYAPRIRPAMLTSAARDGREICVDAAVSPLGE